MSGVGHVSREWHPGFDGAWLEDASGISHDPIESTPNLYHYCGDDPLIGTDPSGLTSLMPAPNPTDTQPTGNVDGIPIIIEPFTGETSYFDCFAHQPYRGMGTARRSAALVPNYNERRCVGHNLCHHMRSTTCATRLEKRGIPAAHLVARILAKVYLPGPGQL